MSAPTTCIMLLPAVCFLQATSTGESEGGEVLVGHRAKVSAPSASLTQDKQTTWSKENLPPSDPKTTGDSHAISSCIIPINVTGKLKKKRAKLDLARIKTRNNVIVCQLCKQESNPDYLLEKQKPFPLGHMGMSSKIILLIMKR